MGILIGIDEAGYGPSLGPLVISAVAFEVPERRASEPLWSVLTHSVTNRTRGRDPRLVIADSKKTHSRAKGIAALEAAALCLLTVSNRHPATLRSLLKILSPAMVDHLDDYPWYRDFDLSLPASAGPEQIKLHANALTRDMQAAGVSFRGVWSEVLLEGHYNHKVHQTRNKSVLLNDLTMRLIHRAHQSMPSQDLVIFIDKQGGRDSYRSNLMRSFESAELEILEEGSEHSRYRLRSRPHTWVISYLQKGETHQLPVALASMYSKYLRELFMIGFNRFWSERVPDLTPTAGYYKDAQRFLGDIDGAVSQLGIRRDALVRVK